MPKRPPVHAATGPISSVPSVATAPQAIKPRRRMKATGSVVEQAITLRSTLREVLSQTAELVRSIKRQRKQDRVLRTTLASLKQLQSAG